MVRETGLNPWLSHTKDTKKKIDASLLNSQLYTVQIKGKAEHSKEWCSPLPYTSVL